MPSAIHYLITLEAFRFEFHFLSNYEGIWVLITSLWESTFDFTNLLNYFFGLFSVKQYIFLQKNATSRQNNSGGVRNAPFCNLKLEIRTFEVEISNLLLLYPASSSCQKLCDQPELFRILEESFKLKFQSVGDIYVTLHKSKHFPTLYFFQELIFCKWASVWKLFSYMFFDTSACFVRSPTITLRQSNDSEAFWFHTVPSQLI